MKISTSDDRVERNFIVKSEICLTDEAEQSFGETAIERSEKR